MAMNKKDDTLLGGERHSSVMGEKRRHDTARTCRASWGSAAGPARPSKTKPVRVAVAWGVCPTFVYGICSPASAAFIDWRGLLARPASLKVTNCKNSVNFFSVGLDYLASSYIFILNSLVFFIIILKSLLYYRPTLQLLI